MRIAEAARAAARKLATAMRREGVPRDAQLRIAEALDDPLA
jgi:hypothetical protein